MIVDGCNFGEIKFINMTLYNTAFQNFDKNYIGGATLAILGQSCLGGAAAMYILSNGTSMVQMVQLGMIVFASMIANTSILAQMSHKTVFNLSILSVVLSVVFIIINHIF